MNITYMYRKMILMIVNNAIWDGNDDNDDNVNVGVIAAAAATDDDNVDNDDAYICFISVWDGHGILPVIFNFT